MKKETIIKILAFAVIGLLVLVIVQTNEITNLREISLKNMSLAKSAMEESENQKKIADEQRSMAEISAKEAIRQKEIANEIISTCQGKIK